MKYIRTKDNKIIDTTNKNYIVNGNDLILHQQYETCVGPEIKTGQMFVPSIAIIQKHNEYSFVGEIIKEADTIEELCDEFVVGFNGKMIISALSFRNSLYYGGDELYGAIWTDKGLIYVAKMNEKGELELL